MKEEIIGLSTLKTYSVKCGDCGHKFGEIELIETNESLKNRGLEQRKVKYKAVHCPKCDGESFETETFEGSTILGPSKDFSIEIEDTEVLKDGTVFVTFTVI